MDLDTRSSVLVVDTDEDTLELVGEYLVARGFQVHTAYSPEDAIALVQNMPVDAVFAEIAVGGMGLELVRLSRARAKPAAVVATMVGDNVRLAVQALKAGADDLLPKPYRLQSVFDALLDALSRRKQEEEQRTARVRLQFYETAFAISEPGEFSRLLGLLAQVALASTQAHEVAVWCPSNAGWSAVARGGSVVDLDGLHPADLVSEGPSMNEQRVAIPLRDRDAQLRAVLAVAGGAKRSTEHMHCLSELARVVVGVWERVDSNQALVGHPHGTTDR